MRPGELVTWLGLLLLAFMFASGCAKLNSIYRRPDLTEHRSLVTDAKQRVVTNSPVEGAPTFVGRINPKRVICAEPSPDVAQAISQSLSGAIQAAITQGTASGQGSANFAQASAESIVQLGERLGTIQLLRDKFYRACEAYANGAISATSYTLMLSRLDKTMTTMMLGEMAAGAFGRALAAAGGSAQASANPAVQDAKDAQQKVDNLKSEVATNETDAKQKRTAADAAKKAGAADADQKENDAQAAEKKLADSRQKLTQAQGELLERVTTAVATSQPALNIGSIGRSSAPSDAVAQSLTVLQQQYLDASDTATLMDACIVATDLMRTPTPEQLTRYSDLTRQLEAHDAQVKALEQRGPLAPQIMDEQTKRRAALQAQIRQVEDELSMSPLGYLCRSGTIDKLLTAAAEQRKSQNTKAQTDFQKARLELCRAGVQSPDEKIRSRAGDCLEELTKVKSGSH